MPEWVQDTSRFEKYLPKGATITAVAKYENGYDIHYQTKSGQRRRKRVKKVGR